MVLSGNAALQCACDVSRVTQVNIWGEGQAQAIPDQNRGVHWWVDRFLVVLPVGQDTSAYRITLVVQITVTL